MHHPMAFVTPIVEHWLEREIAQWVHPMIEPVKDYALVPARSF